MIGSLYLPQIFAITGLQIGVLIGYSGIMVGIALAFRRMNSDADDYFRSGSKGTWWLVGMSSYMAAFSAYTFTGLSGVAYEAGFTSWTTFFGNVIGFAIAGAVFAGWLRQLRVTTGPEVVRDRFGPATEQLYSWMGSIFGLLYAGITLYTVSIFASTVFGMSLEWTIIGIGSTVLLYSLIGGRWAVMGSDFVQGLILIPLTFLLGWIALDFIGGWEGLWSEIIQQGLQEDFAMVKNEELAKFNGNYTWAWVIANTLGLTLQRFNLASAPHFFSAQDGRHAKGSAWMVAILMSASVALFFVPPMVARLRFSELVEAVEISKPAEAAYAIASMQLLPESLLALMLVCIFAATMSAMDTGLNMFSAIYVKNIYPLWCRIRKSEPLTGRKLLRLGEAFTLASGAVIITMALYFSRAEGRGAFEIMLTLGALLGAPMGVPMLWGLFTKKAPTKAAFVSIIFGFVPALVGFLSEWNYDAKVFSVLIVGSLGYFLSYLTPDRSTAAHKRVSEFYKRMHKPVDFAKEVAGLSETRVQARVLGIFSLIAGAAIAFLSFVESGWGLDGRGGTLLLSGIMLIVGSLLLYGTRAIRKPANKIDSVKSEAKDNST